MTQPIEWSIVGDDVSFELHLKNLTQEELAIACQVVAGLQRRRQLAEREIVAPDRLEPNP